MFTNSQSSGRNNGNEVRGKRFEASVLRATVLENNRCLANCYRIFFELEDTKMVYNFFLHFLANVYHSSVHFGHVPKREEWKKENKSVHVAHQHFESGVQVRDHAEQSERVEDSYTRNKKRLVDRHARRSIYLCHEFEDRSTNNADNSCHHVYQWPRLSNGSSTFERENYPTE